MKPIYDLGFFRCHQFPHHSLFWKGFEFPLCMRDTGITIGFLVGVLALYLANNYRSKKVDPRFLLLFVPMAIDGGIQALGFWESSFVSRFLTGLLAGLAIAIAFVALLQKEKKETVPSKKSLLYFTIISIPLFVGYWLIDIGYPIGFVGDFLFWLIVWSLPFLYFIMGVAFVATAWIIFKRATKEMEKSLNRD